MRCPECNETNQVPGAKFCRRCGAPLVGTQIRKRNTVQPQNWGKQNVPSYSILVNKPELQKLRTKLTVTTFVILVIACILLFVKIWPGCLICIPLLLLSILTGMVSIFMYFPNDYLRSLLGNGDDARLQNVCKTIDHSLNMLLLWSGFMFVTGLICMFTVGWWAVLICCILNILAFVFTVAVIVGVLSD